jgi:hypothetical protein
MNRLTLDSIRPCLEGEVPAAIATCDANGTPNVTYVSQVHYVDRDHVALSFQFFNKTRENILANPQVTTIVIHPETSARFRLALLYRRTETEGPLFESMKAKLAGIASQTGMSGVFQLRGADVYQVLDIEHVSGDEAPAQPHERHHLAAVRHATTRMAACTDLAGLLERNPGNAGVWPRHPSRHDPAARCRRPPPVHGGLARLCALRHRVGVSGRPRHHRHGRRRARPHPHHAHGSGICLQPRHSRTCGRRRHGQPAGNRHSLSGSSRAAQPIIRAGRSGRSVARHSARGKPGAATLWL